MATQAQLKAQSKYDKANTWSFVIKLNLNTDADMIAWLKSQDNRQGYIKRLISEDMRKNQQ